MTSGINQFLIILFIILICGCTKNTATGTDNDNQNLGEPEYRIVGYLPDYRISELDASAAKYLTDLIYFSIEPEPDGELNLSRINLNTYTSLNAMRETNPGLKVHIAVGGWARSEHFPAMSGNVSARQNFVQNLTDYCLNNNFHGADFDWEFPANSNENNAYAQLLADTKTEFVEHELQVSVALGVYQNLSDLAYQSVDRVHIMSYDHRGIAKKKLYLGIPFYGREIENFSNTMSYKSIVDTYAPNPDIDEINGLYFNGLTTVKKKVRFSVETGLGGVMVWEIEQDAGGDYSLLNAISEEFNQHTSQ
jgi:GH18 family chitinase